MIADSTGAVYSAWTGERPGPDGDQLQTHENHRAGIDLEISRVCRTNTDNKISLVLTATTRKLRIIRQSERCIHALTFRPPQQPKTRLPVVSRSVAKCPLGAPDAPRQSLLRLRGRSVLR